MKKPLTHHMKLGLLTAGVAMSALCLQGIAFASDGPSEALSDVPVKYLSDDKLPPRTKPLLELGPKFLSTGNISRGITIPTGAVWTPSLWVYGTYRTALQYYEDDNDVGVGEWANRLDLFANLQLSGTERVLIGVTPLHNRDTGLFSGEVFSPDSQKRSINELNFEIDTLFFEGDFAEIFPKLDVFDSTKNDIGITIGRQGVIFSEGFIVNDNMDGIGLSKNNIRFPKNPNIVNWRSSIFVGLNGVHRGDNQLDKDSEFYGWFNQIDTSKTTYNIDVAFVDSENNDDLFNLGFDATRRFGKTNATFRAAFSKALDNETSQAGTGLLVFTELSWVPKHTHDNLYLNGFVGIDEFTSAARGPLNGGPLGSTGLLFAAQGIGSSPSPLSNSAQEAAGVALGYQKFSKDKRRQLTFEAGARFENENGVPNLRNEFGLGVRFQQAVGHRTLFQIDGFTTKQKGRNLSTGIRCELLLKL